MCKSQEGGNRALSSGAPQLWEVPTGYASSRDSRVNGGKRTGTSLLLRRARAQRMSWGHSRSLTFCPHPCPLRMLARAQRGTFLRYSPKFLFLNLFHIKKS